MAGHRRAVDDLPKFGSGIGPYTRSKIAAVIDDSATRQELAIECRELRETLAETVRWLAALSLARSGDLCYDTSQRRGRPDDR